MLVVFQKQDRLVFVLNLENAFLLHLLNFLRIHQLILTFCDCFWPENPYKRELPKCEVAHPFGEIYVGINLDAIGYNITSSVPYTNTVRLMRRLDDFAASKTHYSIDQNKCIENKEKSYNIPQILHLQQLTLKVIPWVAIVSHFFLNFTVECQLNFLHQKVEEDELDKLGNRISDPEWRGACDAVVFILSYKDRLRILLLLIR